MPLSWSLPSSLRFPDVRFRIRVRVVRMASRHLVSCHSAILLCIRYVRSLYSICTCIALVHILCQSLSLVTGRICSLVGHVLPVNTPLSPIPTQAWSGRVRLKQTRPSWSRPIVGWRRVSALILVYTICARAAPCRTSRACRLYDLKSAQP